MGMVLRIVLALVAAGLVTMGGCSKKSEPAAPAKVEAAEQDLDSQLDKLEAQIKADIEADQK
jgi:outer membrane murein-binding lipoprotein Lpp